MVVAAISIKATIGNVHHAAGERQSGTLLMRHRYHTGRVNQATYPHLTRVDIKAHQQVGGSTNLGNREDQASSRIVDRCAGDPKWINIPARKLRAWNRTANVR